METFFEGFTHSFSSNTEIPLVRIVLPKKRYYDLGTMQFTISLYFVNWNPHFLSFCIKTESTADLISSSLQTRPLWHLGMIIHKNENDVYCVIIILNMCTTKERDNLSMGIICVNFKAWFDFFRHLFAIGSASYSAMMNTGENQVIVIR